MNCNPFHEGQQYDLYNVTSRHTKQKSARLCSTGNPSSHLFHGHCPSRYRVILLAKQARFLFPPLFSLVWYNFTTTAYNHYAFVCVPLHSVLCSDHVKTFGRFGARVATPLGAALCVILSVVLMGVMIPGLTSVRQPSRLTATLCRYG